MVIDRVSGERYPVSVTRYILPPPRLAKILDGRPGGIEVAFEDDHLAILVKPENLTTIGATSVHPYEMEGEDLQSCLGFIL